MLTTRYILDEAHLKHYDDRLKSWASSQPVKTIPSTLYPWALTDKAGAVTCWPVGGTELKPKVEFLFTEVPPASGDKGPENPSTISGVSSVKATRCGKNLAELNRVYALPGRGITATVNADGSVHVEGASNNSAPLIDFGNHDDSTNKQLPYWMEVGKTYTLSFNSSNANGNSRALLYLSSSLTSWGAEHAVYPGESYTFLVDDTKKRALIRIRFDTNSTINCDCYLQIEEGSSATSFDGTIPDVCTLSLGSTYYGGTLDVASGVMTVTWVGESVEAFNNTSLVGTNTVAFRFDCSYAHGAMSVTTDELVCNKFVSELGDGDSEHCRFVGSAGYDNMFVRFYISKSRLDVSSAINPASPTDAEWRAAANAWLSSNPVFIAYKINNPFAVQLTPTQILSLSQPDKYTPRLNTVYTDASAVQVGYIKSPIREEYELQQAIVAQGGNV